MKITFQPIGEVHSPFKTLDGMPIQASRSQEGVGQVVVFPAFAQGLADLDGFSHIILLYYLHQSEGYRLKVTPFLDDRPRGLFATRAPKRPNPIGLSILRLTGIQDNVIAVAQLDILDKTPVLDIKPYVPEFDTRSEAVRVGWLKGARERQAISDDRFK